MKDPSKWLNPRAAIGSVLSVVTLLSVASGIVSCTPGGDEGAREANENVEGNDNEADDDDDNEAPNSNDRDDDD
jgi:hypothetical protein